MSGFSWNHLGIDANDLAEDTSFYGDWLQAVKRDIGYDDRKRGPNFKVDFDQVPEDEIYSEDTVSQAQQLLSKFLSDDGLPSDPSKMTKGHLLRQARQQLTEKSTTTRTRAPSSGRTRLPPRQPTAASVLLSEVGPALKQIPSTCDPRLLMEMRQQKIQEMRKEREARQREAAVSAISTTSIANNNNEVSATSASGRTTTRRPSSARARSGSTQGRVSLTLSDPSTTATALPPPTVAWGNNQPQPSQAEVEAEAEQMRQLRDQIARETEELKKAHERRIANERELRERNNMQKELERIRAERMKEEREESRKYLVLLLRETEDVEKAENAKMLQRCFSQWRLCSYQTKIKLQKAKKLMRIRRLGSSFHQWKTWATQQKAEREAEQHAQNLMRERLSERKADWHCRMRHLKTCFYEWRNWAVNEREQRRLKEQQDLRRKKMELLLQQATTTISENPLSSPPPPPSSCPSAPSASEQNSTTINTMLNKSTNQTLPTEKRFSSNLGGGGGIVISTNGGINSSESKKLRGDGKEKEGECDSGKVELSEEQGEGERDGSKSPTKPRVVDAASQKFLSQMQLRDEQRKERRKMLQLKYEESEKAKEKARLAEEERKLAEERARKLAIIEEKKRLRALEKQKEEELAKRRQEDSEKLRRAIDHYLHRTTLHFGWSPWVKYVQNQRAKSKRADEFWRSKSIKRLFGEWQYFVNMKRKERSQEQAVLIARLTKWRRRHLLKLGFALLRKAVESGRSDCDNASFFYTSSLLSRSFFVWHSKWLKRREEKCLRELEKENIADQFCARYLLRTYLREWKSFAVDSKAEREKQKMHEDLKGKVGSWLSEYRRAKRMQAAGQDSRQDE